MKIFDASPIVAILHDTKYPRLIDYIMRLGHAIVIPSYVHGEIMEGPAADMCVKTIRDKKIIVAEANEGILHNP